LIHSDDEETVKKYMGATGGLRKWLEEGKIADAPKYLTAEVCLLVPSLELKLTTGRIKFLTNPSTLKKMAGSLHPQIGTEPLFKISTKKTTQRFQQRR
jgi:hypothetical protein